MNYFEFFSKNSGRHSANIRRTFGECLPRLLPSYRMGPPSWQVQRHSPNEPAVVPARKALGEYSANVRRWPSWQVRRPSTN